MTAPLRVVVALGVAVCEALPEIDGVNDELGDCVALEVACWLPLCVSDGLPLAVIDCVIDGL